MQKYFSYFASIALTAWVGGLWSVGYLAVPVLFRAQADKQLAGMLAGEMFHALGYVGLVCGTIILLQKIVAPGDSTKKSWRQNDTGAVVAMLIIGLVIQFGIAPIMADMKLQARPEDVMHSAYAASFKILHGASSILYLVESLLGLYLVIRANRSQ